MALETNVVPQVETEFLATVRQKMASREGASEMFVWATQAATDPELRGYLTEFLGELINENFALQVQLNGRAEKN